MNVETLRTELVRFYARYGNLPLKAYANDRYVFVQPFGVGINEVRLKCSYVYASMADVINFLTSHVEKQAWNVVVDVDGIAHSVESVAADRKNILHLASWEESIILNLVQL